MADITKDCWIQIISTSAPDGGQDVKRTIIGTLPGVVLGLVATMQLEKDFAEAVISAVKVYNDMKAGKKG